MATTKTTTTKPCAVSKVEFLAHAPLLAVSMDRGDLSGTSCCAALTAAPRQFSSGAVGCWGQTKAQPFVGSTMVKCQVGINMVALGSGDWTQEQKDQAVKGMKGITVRLHLSTGERPKLTADAKGDVKADETAKALGAMKLSGAGVFLASGPRAFSTGSFGWNVTAKIDAGFDGPDGCPVQFQVGINVIAIGSKGL